MRVERNLERFLAAVLFARALVAASAIAPSSYSHRNSYDFQFPIREDYYPKRSYSVVSATPYGGASQPYLEEKPVHGYLYYYSPGSPYQNEDDGYKFSPGLFFTLFLVPLAAILGISYVAPWEVSVAASRSFEVEETKFINDIKEAELRIEQIYFAVIGSQDCLRKVVCDLGASNSNLDKTYKSLIVRAFDLWTPKIYESFIKDYKDGLLKAKCDQFVCTAPSKKQSSNEIN